MKRLIACLCWSLPSLLLFFGSAGVAEIPSRVASAGEDYFIEIEADKEEVYWGEALNVRYTVYVARQYSGEMYEFRAADFSDVSVYEVDPSLFQPYYKNINGRNYLVENLGYYFVFPRRSGKLELPEALIQIPHTKKWIASGKKLIDVTELPVYEGEEEFNPFNVGTFEVDIQPDRSDGLRVGDTVRLTLTIKGTAPTGSIDFQPEYDEETLLVHPESIPRIQNKVSQAGFSSTLTQKFLLTFRKEGIIRAPVFSILSFDPYNSRYVRIGNPELKFEVQGFSELSDNVLRAGTNKMEDPHGYKSISPEYRKPLLSDKSVIRIFFIVSTVLFFIAFVLIRPIRLRREKEASLLEKTRKVIEECDDIDVLRATMRKLNNAGYRMEGYDFWYADTFAISHGIDEKLREKALELIRDAVFRESSRP